jgi:RNA polymerase-binding transcription factor DksA
MSVKKLRTNPRAGKEMVRTRGQATTAAIVDPTAGDERYVRMGQVPPKWAEHWRRLLRLRARLEAERDGHVLAAKQPLEAFSMHPADAATDEFDHELALSLLSAEQDALFEIEAALKRIEKGTYGRCEISGRAIPEGRLNALPWTRFCGDVEQQLELEGRASRPRLGELRSVAGPVTGNLAQPETGQEQPEASPSDEVLSPEVDSPAVAAAWNAFMAKSGHRGKAQHEN